MKKEKSNNISLSSFISLIVTGIGIGWLIGLSVSPVASIVITTVVGVAGAVVTSLSGLERQSSKSAENDYGKLKVNNWPLAILISGIIVGSLVGIRIRDSGILGSEWNREINKWNTYGIDPSDVAQRLYSLQYPFPPDEPYTPYRRNLPWIDGDITAEIERWTRDTGLSKEEVARRLLDIAYPTDANKVIAENIDNNVPLSTQRETRSGLYNAVSNSEDCTSLYRYYRSDEETVDGQTNIALIQEFLDEIQRTNFSVFIPDGTAKSLFLQENVDEERVKEANDIWTVAQGDQLRKVVRELCLE